MLCFLNRINSHVSGTKASLQLSAVVWWFDLQICKENLSNAQLHTDSKTIPEHRTDDNECELNKGSQEENTQWGSKTCESSSKSSILTRILCETYLLRLKPSHISEVPEKIKFAIQVKKYHAKQWAILRQPIDSFKVADWSSDKIVVGSSTKRYL